MAEIRYAIPSPGPPPQNTSRFTCRFFFSSPQWQQANPHRFHLLTLGTMHSLPTPVPRRNQKAYKPAFFDVLKRERESEDGIREVHEWLRMVGPFTPIYPRILSLGFQQDDLGTGWTWKDISTDLGAVLKAKDIAGPLNSSYQRQIISHHKTRRVY